MTYQFRPLTPADFPQMLKWLQTPHVKQWWDDGDDTLKKVAEHYGPVDPGTGSFILLETTSARERPIGYFQYAETGDGTIGIDQFIGEPDCLNRGIGTQAILLFVALIREQYGSVPIVLDPVPENTRAIRCYEKVGFKHVETCPSTYKPGTFAYMMRLDTSL